MSICLIGTGSFDAAVAYQISAHGIVSALCLWGFAVCSRQRAQAFALSPRRRR
jgi:hypothetical protein